MRRTCWVAIAMLAAPLCAGAQPQADTSTSWSWQLLKPSFPTQPQERAQPQRLAQAPVQPALPLPEAVSVPPPPRFDISRFDVQGNSLLSAEEVQAAVGPYTGKSKDFADVQKALEALQESYQRRGYGSVQVVLPEQELEQGVIVLRVLEPKIGRIRIEGNQYFDEANIRRSLPSLEEGSTPNALAIGRSARLANENPAKRATVLLRAGVKEGEVDALVRVQDEKTWRAAVSFDNTGTSSTGMYRLGLAFQEANLFNLDNVVTLQYQLNPEPIEEADELKVLGVGYHIPLYRYDASIDLLAGYSTLGSASGQVIQGVAFDLAGSGTIFGVRYNYLLPRPQWLDEYDHKLSFGLDYKAFSNEVRIVTDGVAGNSITPDITVHPATLTYSASKRMQNAELSFFGSLVRNIYPRGPDAYPEKFFGPDGARPGVGEPRYTVWRYGASYARALPYDLQLRSNITGQWTEDALVPGEQFGIGGWESLRGLHEREGAGDRGYRAAVELYSPDVSSAFGIEGGRLRFLTFFDVGRVRLNFREASEPCGPTACGFSASSVGVGMRMYLRSGVTLRADYGQLLDAGVVAESGDDRWHVGVGVAF